MWHDPKLFPAFLHVGLGCSVGNVCCDRIKAWPTVKQIFIVKLRQGSGKERQGKARDGER